MTSDGRGERVSTAERALATLRRSLSRVGGRTTATRVGIDIGDTFTSSSPACATSKTPAANTWSSAPPPTTPNSSSSSSTNSSNPPAKRPASPPSHPRLAVRQRLSDPGIRALSYGKAPRARLARARSAPVPPVSMDEEGSGRMAGPWLVRRRNGRLVWNALSESPGVGLCRTPEPLFGAGKDADVRQTMGEEGAARQASSWPGHRRNGRAVSEAPSRSDASSLALPRALIHPSERVDVRQAPPCTVAR
jgi:hypothetical protein